MSARTRTSRRDRRRRLGQNFLRSGIAERLVAQADFRPGELVVEVGAGSGVLTRALARRGVELVAVEVDPALAAALRARFGREAPGQVRILRADFVSLPLPHRPFRVMGSLPFGRTTDVLHRLLDDPHVPLERADLVVQWEVACKRAAAPPSTLLSAAWAPWWEFRLGPRIPAEAFRPVPGVAAGVLTVLRRRPPLLPPAMARAWAAFVRAQWPFERGRSGGGIATADRRRV